MIKIIQTILFRIMPAMTLLSWLIEVFGRTMGPHTP